MDNREKPKEQASKFIIAPDNPYHLLWEMAM